MGILETVEEKLRHGERLTDDDALALFHHRDLIGIGRLADAVNRQKNGPNVFYNINRHINPTNICALSCKFCAFSRKPGEEGAYAYEIDEIITKANAAVAQGATEVHMVGGLHPRWPFKHYLQIIAALRANFPELHIKAFTAVELDWMARRDRRTVAEILQDLVAAGLGSLPGGGAEIFHPEIRDQICDTKVSAEQWIDTHRTAHRMGLRSNCTMLYGHIESYSHRVDHMRRIRELQDETAGFSAFIPLAFQPFDNDLGKTRYTFGYDDLKTIAIARLYLDNIRNIKAYWIMLGQDIAQIALNFGANDLDGTVTEEKISRMAGGKAGMVMARNEITSLIAKADCYPVERDTLYRPLSPLYKPHRSEPAATDPLASAIDDQGFRRVFTLAQRALKNTPVGKNMPRTFAYSLDFPWSLAPDHAPEAAAASLATTMAAREARHALTTSALILDFARATQEEFYDLGYLGELLAHVRKASHGVSVVGRSFTGAELIARRNRMPIDEFFELLQDIGVTAFESAPDSDSLASCGYTELDLERYVRLHRMAHDADIATVAHATLRAAGREERYPQEDQSAALSHLLSVFSRLHDDGVGLLGLALYAGEGVSASEYLRCLAWTRCHAESVPHLIAPFHHVATLRPVQENASLCEHPALKVAPLALHFGADDLGHIAAPDEDPWILLEEMRASGFVPALRNGQFHVRNTAMDHEPQMQKLRHLPAVTSVHA